VFVRYILIDLARTLPKILGLLADGVPRGIHDISVELGLGKRAVEGACYRGWKKGLFLRSKNEVYGRLTRFRGRSGNVTNNRGYYHYLCFLVKPKLL